MEIQWITRWRRLLLAVGLCLLLMFSNGQPAASIEQSATSAPPTFNCTTPFTQPSLGTLPPPLTADNPGITTQDDINCYAWQTFFALNWPGDLDHPGQPDPTKTSPQDFGQPKDFSPTVWETYKNPGAVFLPKGKKPLPWGASSGTLPPACQKIAGKVGKFLGGRILISLTEADDDIPLLESVDQAFTQNGWLTAQNKTQVRYEIGLNKDEFEYLYRNELYDAANQKDWAMNQGMDLPVGRTQYGDEGTIEIKAAWKELKKRDAVKHSHYKKTMAYLYNPDEDSCKLKKMGLVGLHIIHKTPSMPQYMWMTFEHVENDPSIVDAHSTGPYAFFNPDCPADPDPATQPECVINRLPQKDDPIHRPIQVERTVPIPGAVQTLNAAVKELIQQNYTDSVWQYYELVDVLWPKVGFTPPKGQKVPLPAGSPASTGGDGLEGAYVLNSTLETYFQRDLSSASSENRNCLSCHIQAPIAGSNTIGGDYSFIIDDAQSSKSLPSE